MIQVIWHRWINNIAMIAMPLVSVPQKAKNQETIKLFLEDCPRRQFGAFNMLKRKRVKYFGFRKRTPGYPQYLRKKVLLKEKEKYHIDNFIKYHMDNTRWLELTIFRFWIDIQSQKWKDAYFPPYSMIVQQLRS